MADQVQEELISQYQFYPDDYGEEQEQQKKDWLNQAAEDREAFNRETRRALEEYISPRQSAPGTTAKLYFLAYDTLCAVIRKGQLQEADIEPFLKIRQEFEETADPGRMKMLADQADRLNRMPRELRDIMEEDGTKITQLVSWTFEGTEPLSRGAADREEDEDAAEV